MVNMEEQWDMAVRKQKTVAIVSEMMHTPRLVYDDILAHAESRMGKKSVNVKLTMGGDFILAVEDKEVVVILSKGHAYLVQWEFMWLQNKEDE